MIKKIDYHKIESNKNKVTLTNSQRQFGFPQQTCKSVHGIHKI
jgi:hypothetical protein